MRISVRYLDPSTSPHGVGLERLKDQPSRWWDAEHGVWTTKSSYMPMVAGGAPFDGEWFADWVISPDLLPCGHYCVHVLDLSPTGSRVLDLFEFSVDSAIPPAILLAGKTR